MGSPLVDTDIPIFFLGHQVLRQIVTRHVAPHEIAATLAAYLGVEPPSGSVGTPLVRVLPSG